MHTNQSHGQPTSVLKNWLPVSVRKEIDAPVCEWLFTGEKNFTEPFFDQTLAACRYANIQNRRYKSISDLDMMVQWSTDLTTLPVSAVIFHVSRCGSTLLSQLLSEDKTNLVLSEVPFFDDLLRLPLQYSKVDNAASLRYFRTALAWYGRPRHGHQHHLFLKTDSWHLHFYRQYRQCLPGVPFFLLYRHPLEVIRSQQKQRGLHAVPGLLEPELFGLDKSANATNLDHYMATVLSTYLQQAISLCENDPLFFSFDYSEGIPAICRAVYTHLNRPLDAALEERFAERSRFHAKHPSQFFTGDELAADPPAYLEAACELYRKLGAVGQLVR
jgi:hypothetical protein